MRIDSYMTPDQAAAWFRKQGQIEQEAQWERHRERMKRSKEKTQKGGSNECSDADVQSA